MKKLKYLTVIIIVLLLSFWWLFPQVGRCLLVQYDDFAEISPNIFVSSSTSAQKRMFLLKNIEVARERIKAFWGGELGHATIIFCDKPTIYSRYCQTSEGSGCSVGTPFGSWIILNYDGLNADVIAHEMCHDELLTRTGWLRTKQEIPTWFDEGLALQLDDRFVSSHDSIQRYIDYRAELLLFENNPIPLAALNTSKQFFVNDRIFSKIAYLTAATEVSHKISTNGRMKVIGLLDDVKKGQNFEKLYFTKE